MTLKTLPIPPETPGVPTIPNVRILGPLGRGESSEVFLGLHIPLKRQVAVKVIHAHLAESPEVVARFQQEASAAAGLRHPNIVQVYDHRPDGGRPYIVMEYLPGPTLAQYLETARRRGSVLPWKMSLLLAAKLAEALDYAHARGVIHRDVKPGNVGLRSQSGDLAPNRPLPDDTEPVLMDFGVARLSGSALRTGAGAFIGTPAYMSPEQIMGEGVDARSDIYSLGIVLYQMLAGDLPKDLRSESVTAVLYAHLQGRFPRLPESIRQLEPIVERCVALKRDKRYATAGKLALDLQRVRQHRMAGPSLKGLFARTAFSVQELRGSLFGSRPRASSDAATVSDSPRAPAQRTQINFNSLRRILGALPEPRLVDRGRRRARLGTGGLAALGLALAVGLAVVFSRPSAQGLWALLARGQPGTPSATQSNGASSNPGVARGTLLTSSPTPAPSASVTRMSSSSRTPVPSQMPTSTKTQPAASPTAPPPPTATSIIPPLPTLPLPTLPLP